jgi:hypothetical protein
MTMAVLSTSADPSRAVGGVSAVIQLVNQQQTAPSQPALACMACMCICPIPLVGTR